MEEIIRLIDLQGWGYSFEKFRPTSTPAAYVHAKGSCYGSWAATPRAALAGAYAKAMQAQLLALGIKPAEAA